MFGSEQQPPIDTKTGQLVKIKRNFSNSSLIGLLKIILKVFLFILVDRILEKLPAVLSFQMES